MCYTTYRSAQSRASLNRRIPMLRNVLSIFALVIGLTACGESSTGPAAPPNYLVSMDTTTHLLSSTQVGGRWVISVRAVVTGTHDVPKTQFETAVDNPKLAKVTASNWLRENRFSEVTGEPVVIFLQILEVEGLAKGAVNLRIWHQLDPRKATKYVLAFE